MPPHENQGESRVRENFTHGLVREANVRPRVASFTLVELLVVIAIIAILAGLLFPALARARGLTRQSVCLNNMKNVSVAINMLANDNEGWVDHGHTGATWNEAIRAATYGLTNLMIVRNKEYSKLCPSFQGGSWTHYGGGYGLNSSFQNPIWSKPPYGEYGPFSLWNVRRRTTTFLVCDYRNTDAIYPGTFDTVCSGYPPYYDLEPKGRHEGRGVNMIFVDGHGEFAKREDAIWWQANTENVNPPYLNPYGSQLIWGP
jgi:prepilin-type N-terminal cleavage/methylation domain-containing protein/prepilin-type processing-associated H-X9-DG protein